MKNLGIHPEVLRAGNANMFLSPVFQETLAGTGDISIELYDTDGSVGAAQAAGIGSGVYSSFEEAFSGLQKIKVIEPSGNNSKYTDAYNNWKNKLELLINK